MKIHISINEQSINGYINLTPLQGEDTIVGDFRNFDHICETCCAEEIYAPHILDYVHASQLVDILKYWKSRLRHGGKLIVGGTDLFEFCKGVVSGQIDGANANRMLFGQLHTTPFVKSGAFTWSDIENILYELELKIVHKRIYGREFVVEAHRD